MTPAWIMVGFAVLTVLGNWLISGYYFGKSVGITATKFEAIDKTLDMHGERLNVHDEILRQQAEKMGDLGGQLKTQ